MLLTLEITLCLSQTLQTMSLEQNLSSGEILLLKTNLVLEGLKGTKEEVEKPEGLPTRSRAPAGPLDFYFK